MFQALSWKPESSRAGFLAWTCCPEGASRGPQCLCPPGERGLPWGLLDGSAGPFSGLCADGIQEMSVAPASGAQSLGWGAPQCSVFSMQPRTPGLWLPARCVTLCTLGSGCLGFPTHWAAIGLLAESARVLLRHGLARAWAPGEVVCHGFLRRRRGRWPHASAEPTILSPALPGSGSSVAALNAPTPGAGPMSALCCDSVAVAKEGPVPGPRGRRCGQPGFSRLGKACTSYEKNTRPCSGSSVLK